MTRNWQMLGVIIVLITLGLAACNAPPLQGDETPTPEETGTPEATPTAEGAPTVIIDAPPSGTEVAVGEELLVQSTSTDTVGVTRVDLQVDGVVVRSDTTPVPEGQPSFALLQGWIPSAPGAYALTVIAYRADGTASAPAGISVTVAEAAADVESGDTAMSGGGGGGVHASDTTGPCTVRANTDLNVRTGPGTSYDIVGVLGIGQSAPVVGRNGSTSWWQVSYSGGTGWVSAPYAAHSGNCTSIPVAEAGPPPVTVAGSGGVPTYTPTYVPGDAPTPTYTQVPSDGPTPTYTSTVAGPSPTPSYTPTTQAAAQEAPADSTFNSPLNIPLDNTASVLDFVSYPGGDTEDRVRWDITGMNPNSALSGGRARLVIQVTCFGTGTEHIQFFTGGQTYSCGSTIVDREVTYDSRTGQVTITAIGGEGTYVQWVLTGTATRTS